MPATALSSCLEPAAGAVHPPLEDNQGWCASCGKYHTLAAEAPWQECLVLMDQLARYQRLDFGHPDSGPLDVRCSTQPLFAANGGKMFGVLLCQDQQGRRQKLRAFSGQYNGLWHIDGWVPPVFDTVAFDALNATTEPVIKQLGQQIELSPDAIKRVLVEERRHLSQALMRDIHALYKLTNFRGQTRPLTEVFQGNGAPPTGTGDCCGPKLLNYAATHRLAPIALAEFFWGCESAAGSRIHGQAYPPCAGRCIPILGFMLCGLELEPCPTLR